MKNWEIRMEENALIVSYGGTTLVNEDLKEYFESGDAYAGKEIDEIIEKAKDFVEKEKETFSFWAKEIDETTDTEEEFFEEVISRILARF